MTYQRGEGSRLWCDAMGERPVWDFLGGYGSTLFGHNHPELVRVVTDFLRQRGVVHAQASRRPTTAELVERLARRLERSTGQSYRVLLANTGSEAVETAAVHAEMELARRRRELERAVTPPPDRGDPPRWDSDGRRTLLARGIPPDAGALARVAAHNRAVLARPAVHLAVEGSYHGMTARARTLTDGPDRRFAEAGRGGDVRFVSRDEPDGVEARIDELRGELLRLRPQDGGWSVDVLPWLPVASLFVEPVQGERGIRPLPREVGRAWASSCRRHGVPLVVDEIQSGMGRTGTFLHAEQLGLRPDYVLLGKSLGGGLAKISAVAVRDQRFQPDFTLRHASTFAEDDLSSAVAVRALALLDEEDALRRARERGAVLLRALRGVRDRYPEIVADIRGSGLMLGVEYHAGVFDRSPILEFFREHGWLGYLMSAFLLRGHGVRVAPTLAHSRTLRIEPAYGIPDEAVDRLVGGMEALCRALGAQDSAALLGPSLDLAPSRAAPGRGASDRVAHLRPPRRADAHVGFVGHFIDPGHVELWDPGFGALGPDAGQIFLDRVLPLAEPVLGHRGVVTSANGARTALTFVGLPVASCHFHRSLRGPGRRPLRALVQRAVDRAAAEGCTVVGLGGYASIVTRNGKALRSDGPALTTGNGYTVGAALEALRSAAEAGGIDWPRARGAVVGAIGNMGAVLARLLAAELDALILVGRKARLGALESLAGQLLRERARRVPDGPVAGAFRGASPTVDAYLFHLAREALGCDCPVTVGSDPALCREASVIVTASNDARPILRAEHLGRGPVVVDDLSVPSDVHPSVHTERPDVRVIRGGIVRTPADPDWWVPGLPLSPGEMYACMAETVLMGFEGHRVHGSLGSLTPERVRETLEMARRHGFRSARPAMASSY